MPEAPKPPRRRPPCGWDHFGEGVARDRGWSAPGERRGRTRWAWPEGRGSGASSGRQACRPGVWVGVALARLRLRPPQRLDAWQTPGAREKTRRRPGRASDPAAQARVAAPSWADSRGGAAKPNPWAPEGNGRREPCALASAATGAAGRRWRHGQAHRRGGVRWRAGPSCKHWPAGRVPNRRPIRRPSR